MRGMGGHSAGVGDVMMWDKRARETLMTVFLVAYCKTQCSFLSQYFLGREWVLDVVFLRLYCLNEWPV